MQKELHIVSSSPVLELYTASSSRSKRTFLTLFFLFHALFYYFFFFIARIRRVLSLAWLGSLLVRCVSSARLHYAAVLNTLTWYTHCGDRWQSTPWRELKNLRPFWIQLHDWTLSGMWAWPAREQRHKVKALHLSLSRALALSST